MLNKKNIIEKWGKLTPSQKKTITFCTIGIFLFVFCVFGWHSRTENKVRKTNNKITKNKTKSIDLNTRLIKESLITETRNRINDQDKIITELKENIKVLTDMTNQKIALRTETQKVRTPEQRKPVQKIPPFPAPPSYTTQPGSNEIPENIMLGGITITHNEVAVEKNESNNKKKLQIYLPPSFMEATLLSGVRAPTTSAGKNNPLPVLFRIKNLAILPNKVKGNLKGCFVIGEGTGNLADERVHVRLLTLSCVSKKGTAVIDQSIKGFVMDEDGIIGLDGTVVAKMGSMLARSALAGALGGIGDAVRSSSFDTQTTALGTQQILYKDDASDIARSAFGGAISGASKDLQKFYLQLAAQTMPVVEVGSTKSITLVISEGVSLEVKETNVLQ